LLSLGTDVVTSHSQDGSRARRVGWLLLALLLAAIHPSVLRAADAPAVLSPEGPEVFGFGSPVGRIDYRAGRGLHVGDTGLTLGGFATLEAERLEGGDSRGAIDALSFFVFYDPVAWLHFFSQIDVDGLASVESGREGVRSHPTATLERLYVDLGRHDAANLRVGKFLTPFGRWNQVLADPLLWTTSEPLIVEQVFDENVTGAMVWGNLFPGGQALTYDLYGTFFDAIQPDEEEPPAPPNCGGRLEWTSGGGSSIGASYFASERPHGGAWNHLGGVDGLWRPHERVELSGEALFGEGSQEDGFQWGLYAQAVVETLPTLYAVGRYEHYDPPASGRRRVDTFDLGLTWVPKYYLRLKVDYLFADHLDELSAPGLRASFSVLF
jgi:hypothetical protein